MIITSQRDTFGDTFCLGSVWIGSRKFCECLEDKDRGLENGGTKVPGQTAIPRGRYRVTLEDSQRFGPGTITLNDVPDFMYIRVHGANDDSDVRGCIGVGRYRTNSGIRDCREVVSDLKREVRNAIASGEEVWWEVK